LYTSGISHPIDFTLPIIDVLPVNVLNDLNKLITLSKKEVQYSKNFPEAYTSDNIDITRQTGFIEKRYLYKKNSNLQAKLLSIATKNKLSNNPTISDHTSRFSESKYVAVGSSSNNGMNEIGNAKSFTNVG